MAIEKIKISQLPQAETLFGFKTLGVNSENKSVSADLPFTGEPAAAASAAAENADRAAGRADEAAGAANQAAQDVVKTVQDAAKETTERVDQAFSRIREEAETVIRNAQDAVTDTNSAVSEATTQANYAKSQGDYAKAQGDAVENKIGLSLQQAKEYADEYKVDKRSLGAADGVAQLDSAGRVPASQLPSYVDDVLEFDELSGFPRPGEAGKIYVAVDTNLTYRWSGSDYVEIGTSLALGETSSTAYRGDRGKTAYEHTQLTASGSNPHNTTFSSLSDRPVALPAAGGTAASLGNGGDVAQPITFNCSVQAGQPVWVWGGNVRENVYAYDPTVFNVASAIRATQDGAGNVIANKYMTVDTDQSVSGVKVFNGRVGIGRNPQESETFAVNGAVFVGRTIDGAACIDAHDGQVYFGYGRADNGIRVSSNGECWGSVFHGTNFTTSDLRKKEDIREPEAEECRRALEVRTVRFAYRDNDIASCGYIAQETMDAGLGFLVHADGEYMELDYTGLHSLQIEALKRKVSELESKVRELAGDVVR